MDWLWWDGQALCVWHSLQFLLPCLCCALWYTTGFWPHSTLQTMLVGGSSVYTSTVSCVLLTDKLQSLLEMCKRLLQSTGRAKWCFLETSFLMLMKNAVIILMQCCSTFFLHSSFHMGLLQHWCQMHYSSSHFPTTTISIFLVMMVHSSLFF